MLRHIFAPTRKGERKYIFYNSIPPYRGENIQMCRTLIIAQKEKKVNIELSKIERYRLKKCFYFFAATTPQDDPWGQCSAPKRHRTFVHTLPPFASFWAFVSAEFAQTAPIWVGKRIAKNPRTTARRWTGSFAADALAQDDPRGLLSSSFLETNPERTLPSGSFWASAERILWNAMDNRQKQRSSRRIY